MSAISRLPAGIQPREAIAQEETMRERSFTLPELALIAGTRVALGIGVGLLISNRLTPDQRRGAGIALAAVGAITTLPLAFGVWSKPARPQSPLDLSTAA